MRGKITIIVILAGSALFYWYAFWYFNSVSPADVRFNMMRKEIAANAKEPILFPPAVGDYILQSVPTSQIGDIPTQAADYAVQKDKLLHMVVLKFSDADTAKQYKDSYFSRQCSETPHLDAKVPYTYYECKDNQPEIQRYIFTWVNSQYRFMVISPDVEQLVQFVNGYPY